MFVKIVMAFAIILVSIQALPAPKPRQWSKIFAARAERTLYDDVTKAIDECRNTTSRLLVENYKIYEQIQLFMVASEELIKHFTQVVEKTFYMNNATCTDYFSKADEQGVDITPCYNNWLNSNAIEVERIARTIDSHVVAFFEEHMQIGDQNSGVLFEARNDLETLDLQAWACENDECLQVLMDKVRPFEEYIDDLAVRISAAVDEVMTSSGEILIELFALVDGLVEVSGSITNEFVKCAEDILG